MATRKETEKTAARKPAARRVRKPKISHEQIAERAYYITLDTGASELDSWLRAERELVAV